VSCFEVNVKPRKTAKTEPLELFGRRGGSGRYRTGSEWTVSVIDITLNNRLIIG